MGGGGALRKARVLTTAAEVPLSSSPLRNKGSQLFFLLPRLCVLCSGLSHQPHPVRHRRLPHHHQAGGTHHRLAARAGARRQAGAAAGADAERHKLGAPGELAGNMLCCWVEEAHAGLMPTSAHPPHTSLSTPSLLQLVNPVVGQLMGQAGRELSPFVRTTCSVVRPPTAWLFAAAGDSITTPAAATAAAVCWANDPAL